MRVQKINLGGDFCNSYILTNDGKRAVIIDCAEGLYGECLKLDLKPAAVLLTHGHFDHVGGCGEFYENGVPVYCGEREERYIFSPENKNIFGGVYIPEFKIYKTLRDGETVELGGINFKTISTPGHTAGGVCYLSGDSLFTGDTLFKESIGRYDLPTGDGRALFESLKKLRALDGDYKVYCGHGENTTLNYERKHNPYLR